MTTRIFYRFLYRLSPDKPWKSFGVNPRIPPTFDTVRKMEHVIAALKTQFSNVEALKYKYTETCEEIP